MTQNRDVGDAVVVITGAASGIGRGMAEAFLEAGARVVIADVEEDALQRTATELDVLGVLTDVTDPESVDELAARTCTEFGNVHVVCNNAGVGPFGSVAEMSLSDWRFVLDVNLWGVIHGVSSFLPLLRQNGSWGHIVNTSSVSVFLTPPEAAAYVASKAAVLGLTESLSAELKRDASSVGTTALLPGAVRSNIKNSLRSRPVGERSGLRNVDLAASGREFAWLDPIDVGRRVVDAVREDQLYLTTASTDMAAVAARSELIQRDAPGSKG